jgi:hypothetical protein
LLQVGVARFHSLPDSDYLKHLQIGSNLKLQQQANLVQENNSFRAYNKRLNVIEYGLLLQ